MEEAEQANPSLGTWCPHEDYKRWTGVYTWHWKGSSQSADKVYSNKFELGTYVWRILAYPKGNQSKPHLSLYLDASPEMDLLQPFMYPNATFTFTIVNQLDESKSWTKEASKSLFKPELQSLGFPQTLSLEEVHNISNGFLVNDEVIIKLQVSVLRDVGHRSRMPLGCVGLQAQEGHMGYMNPVLQYLYHLPLLRKAVYQVPAVQLGVAAGLNVPIAALQTVFYQLQYSHRTVSTKGLDKLFNCWDTLNTFIKGSMHDLDRGMRSEDTTCEEPTVSEMFEGHTITHIKCVNTGNTAEQREPYMSVQLNVGGCLTLYEAFDRYTTTAITSIPLTEGSREQQQHVDVSATSPTQAIVGPEQQYQDKKMAAAAHLAAVGKAKRFEYRTVLFESFPPVLQLQLRRSEDAKIPADFSFPMDLDLDWDSGRYLSTVTPHTSTVTPHTSTVTPHTSTVTPHTSTVTPHTSTVTPHTSTVTPHTSTVTYQTHLSQQGSDEQAGVDQQPGVDQPASQPPAAAAAAAAAASQGMVPPQQQPPCSILNQYTLHSILMRNADNPEQTGGGMGSSEGPIRKKGPRGGGKKSGGRGRSTEGGVAAGDAGPSGVGKAQVMKQPQLFVRPDGKTWVRYNKTDSVTEESLLSQRTNRPDGPEILFRFANAYMLVYVRTSDWDRIMCPVSKADVSPCVLERLEAELCEEHRRQQDKLEAHMYINIKVATDHEIQQAVSRCPYGLLNHGLVEPHISGADPVVIRVKKDTKFGALRAMVAQHMGANLSQYRLWLWGKLPNNTYRATTTLNHIPDDTPLIDIKEFRDQGRHNRSDALFDVCLYMEVPGFKHGEPIGALYKRKPATTLDCPGEFSDVFVFIKYYDPHLELMRYVGKGYLPLTSTGAQEDTPPDVTLEVWEEIDFDHPLDKGRDTQTIKTFGDKRTLLDRNLKDGSILVVQPKITVEAAHDIKMPTCRQYMQYVRRVGFAVAYEEGQARAQEAQTLDAALAQALLPLALATPGPAAGAPAGPEGVKEGVEESEEEEPELPPPEKRYDWELELMCQDQH